MQAEDFYIAELGVRSEDIIEKYPKQMDILGTSFNAVEVFETPYDAVRNLNKFIKLMPEHHVTIYRSINDCNFVTISNNSESRILAIADNVNFKKYHTMALGSLIYSL